MRRNFLMVCYLVGCALGSIFGSMFAEEAWRDKIAIMKMGPDIPPVPEGVSAELWRVMTPQERALWSE